VLKRRFDHGFRVAFFAGTAGVRSSRGQAICGEEPCRSLARAADLTKPGHDFQRRPPAHPRNREQSPGKESSADSIGPPGHAAAGPGQDDGNAKKSVLAMRPHPSLAHNADRKPPPA
jgi:hypothetical protein